MFDAGFLLGFLFVPEDAKCSSETSVDFQENARGYITEDRTHQGQISEHYFCSFACMYLYNAT